VVVVAREAVLFASTVEVAAVAAPKLTAAFSVAFAVVLAVVSDPTEREPLSVALAYVSLATRPFAVNHD
jgi:hypothetical protein